MLGARVIILGALTAMLALAGCSRDKTPELMNLRSSGSPDEFAILPVKPIEMPADMAALPVPTPGGSNRTDPTPQADAVAALGGRPALLADGAVPSADGGLVSQASRYGVAAGIRQTLAAEDLEYRRQNNGRLLERAFNVNMYFKAYAQLTLDQYAELERWRRAGARNVGAPPPPEQ